MRAACSLVFACTVLLAIAAPAQATFPGKNGLLVFEAQVGKRVQLFTISPQGGAAHQLTHFADSDAVWPSWSPDGSRIAFERDFGDRAGVYLIQADGTGLRPIIGKGLNGRPSWSPDGKTLVFSSLVPGHEGRVSLIRADGGGLRVVARAPLLAKGGCDCGLSSPVFSSDGRTIAFTWTRSADESAIFTAGADGSAVTRITPWKNGVADKIDWSPDGSRIGFSSPAFGKPGVSSNVFTVRSDGSGLVQLTHRSGGKLNAGFDGWSPDGKQIAFAGNPTGAYAIYTMRADGTHVTRLTHGLEAHHAAWGRHP